MFNAIFNKICEVIYAGARIVKALISNEWVKNTEQATGYDHAVLSARNTSVNWIKWFKGEYRMAYSAYGFDGIRNYMAGLAGAVVTTAIASTYFVGWPFIIAITISLFIGYVGGKMTQAIDLKMQLTERLIRQNENKPMDVKYKEA